MTDPDLIGGRYQVTDLIGTLGGDRRTCPHAGYVDARNPAAVFCMCVVCARCGQHTGNSNQGHYWRWCKVTKTMRDFHYCCPGNCELEAS